MAKKKTAAKKKAKAPVKKKAKKKARASGSAESTLVQRLKGDIDWMERAQDILNRAADEGTNVASSVPRSPGGMLDRRIWRVDQALRCLRDNGDLLTADAYLKAECDDEFERETRDVHDVEPVRKEGWVKRYGDLIVVKLDRPIPEARSGEIPSEMAYGADFIFNIATGLLTQNRFGRTHRPSEPDETRTTETKAHNREAAGLPPALPVDGHSSHRFGHPDGTQHANGGIGADEVIGLKPATIGPSESPNPFIFVGEPWREKSTGAAWRIDHLVFGKMNHVLVRSGDDVRLIPEGEFRTNWEKATA